MKPAVAQAYDTIAAGYDQQVEGDLWMRQQLWRHYLDAFQPRMHLLDVACGTGIDALFLAEHGMHVTGIDLSPAMIEQLRRKAENREIGDRVKSYVLEVSALQAWPAQGFDGILSAFAGLNTVADLNDFAANAAHLLRPGGRMILHLLNRFSLWEWVGLFARGQWSAAHALGQQHERTFWIGGKAVKHTLYLPKEAYRFFAGHFMLRRCYSLGALRPPPSLPRIHPALRDALGGLERYFGAYPPFLNWGRFFVLDLEKV